MHPSATPAKLRQAAADPNTSLETLAQLANRCPHEVSNNPALYLAIAAGQDFIGLLEYVELDALLACRTTPPDLLLYFVSHFNNVPVPGEHVRQALTNPNLPREAIPMIEAQVAAGHYTRPTRHLDRHRHNPHAWSGDPTPRDILTAQMTSIPFAFTWHERDQIARLPDWALDALKQNPSIKDDLDEWLELREWEDRRRITRRTHRAHTYPGIFPTKLLFVLDEIPNPNIISYGARDKDPDVRLAVAHNPSVDRATLERLALDPDLPTAHAAERTLASLT